MANDDKKPWYRSRTIWLAIAQAIGGGAAIAAAPGVGTTAGTIAVAKSILDIYLRATTTAPVGSTGS